VYASLNGHAHYAAPGANPSQHRNIPAFYLRNDTAVGGYTLDCGRHHEIVAAWPQAGIAEPSWLDYAYRWGPEGTATSLPMSQIYPIIRAVLGDVLTWILTWPGVDDAVEEVAQAVIDEFGKDDLNGPDGPKQSHQWYGRY